MILKVPEICCVRQGKKNKREKEEEEESSNKAKDNTHFLRLMQNHQMEEKVDMKLDRIMSVFFKKDSQRRKSLKGEESSP